MAVDLSDYVDSLKREVNPPGTDEFPNATEDDWVGNLSDAFWEARLDGMLEPYTEEDAIVNPIDPNGEDIPRDLIQLVVLYASFRIIRNALRGLRTQFAATAGPVKFEYQQSAQVLTALLKDINIRRDHLLSRLSDMGVAPDFIIDSVIARSASIMAGETWFVGF